MYKAITERRSIRAYLDKPVPRELLEKLVSAARWSASAGNLQPCHYYIIQSRSILKNLFDTALLGTGSWQYQAPACIVVTAEPEISSQRYGTRGQHLYCIQDSAIATTNIMLMAHDLGLGTCWIGAFDTGECAKVLGLPDRRVPMAILTIGYPARIPEPTPRKELDDITTWIG